MMKTVNLRVCLSVISLMSLGLFVPETRAAGPAVAQQTLSQIQSKLTEASVGWRHGRRCCGYGYGGFGYGGMGYRGMGYRGWGGYGGWGGGYGGYYGGYGGYGYGGYGYPGYSYSYVRVRPRFYSAYTYSSPYAYASPYAYSTPYPSAYCCGVSAYQPAVYGVSNYSYGAQPVYASSTYSTPAYSSPVIYSGSPSSYANPVYTPSTVSPSVITSPSVIYPTSISYPAAAPYPAPPVEIQPPSAYQAPIATTPKVATLVRYPISESMDVPLSTISTPAYSPTFAYTGVPTASYSAPSYGYYHQTAYRPSTVSALSRMSAGIVW